MLDSICESHPLSLTDDRFVFTLRLARPLQKDRFILVAKRFVILLRVSISLSGEARVGWRAMSVDFIARVGLVSTEVL